MKIKNILLAVGCLLAATLPATETQNTSIRVLPAPGAVEIDGRFDDWDLRGGVFACGELENLRDQYAVWMHLMHDAEYFYVLARWRDSTPLNNTETFGGHGFNADCLQFRTILFTDTPDETALWWMFWRDAAGTDVADRSSPGPENGHPDNVLEPLPRAAGHGVKQAFLVDGDGKGYSQEIAIPWKLMSASGRVPAIGDTFRFTVEPNFTAGSFGRITIKDIFDERIATPDRIFTFTAWRHWGWATMVGPDAEIAPQPVKTADGRSFPVTMEDGLPVVNWAGLIRRFEWPGFKEIAFDMPFDGRVSLNILDGEGHVARHLLNWERRGKGPQTTKWDGLDDAVFRTPGHPVSAGSYAWKAIAHPGARLTFRGYACYGGAAPWSGKPTDTWLGDHGVPSDAATDGTRMILACNGAEGGRHLLACDFEGRVEWSTQNTTGMGDPEYIAVDDSAVYVLHVSWNPSQPFAIAKVDSSNGGYTSWEGRGSHLLSLADCWSDGVQGGPRANGIAAGGGKVFLSYAAGNARGVAMLDAATGNALASWPLPGAHALHFAGAAGHVLVATADGISTLDPATGTIAPLVEGVDNIRGVTASADGSTLYASLGDPDMQVAAYDAATGRELRRYGVPGGHPRVGKWNPDGMIDPAGLAVDKTGQLWVMEHYAIPKRVSVWKLGDGSLVRDFFGPAHYGASGAAINPRDKNLMVGEGCEWRLDPETGKSVCLGAFDTSLHGFAAFREGPGNRQFLYLVKMGYGTGAIEIHERLGDADYRLLAVIRNDREADDGGQRVRFTDIWIDRNGDGREQPGEVESRRGPINFSGSNSWSLNLGPDLSLYGYSRDEGILWRFAPGGFAENGAPLYSFATATEMPRAMSHGYQDNYSSALPDCENKVILVNLRVEDHPAGFVWHGFDLASGELLWTYPNPFFQVHGSHNAPASEPGLFRGAYGPVGALATDATGPFWTINGNLGEWYALSSEGFFLTQLFSGNVFEWVWPDTPAPGADMMRLPCGGGGEDFGGSATLVKEADGSLTPMIQSGKIGIWNIELEGLDQTVVVGEGTLELTEEDTAKAAEMRDRALQAATGEKRISVKSGDIAFTGNLSADFAGRDIVEFKKSDDASVRAAAAYSDTTLYLGWEVRDATPWVNGASDYAQLYAFGDTVDFQLGTDPDAPADRSGAAKGDLRLSIGNLQGTATAVLYRFVCDEKKPRTFSSGVIQGYEVDFVDIVRDAVVRAYPMGDRTVVEAAIPQAALGVELAPGLTLRGDFGATHGTPAGDDTRLRTHWANQQTGLTDDVVFELQITPKNWGTLSFE
ncbi:MAG: hypothetical protein ACOX5G_13985 [Kiritimatiellia bacterium]|jgi:hypothetical protein